MKWLSVLLCAIFAIIPSVLSSVPVLIWNTNENENINNVAVPALRQLTVASMQASYPEAFKSDNILLFLQDSLSIEDLSSHPVDMKHVKHYMEESKLKLYFPNVIEPSQLQHDLIKQGYKVTKLSAGSAISELQLDTGVKNLVIVKVPPTNTSPIRSKALRKADEVIHSVLSKIGGMADFTVIYTGEKSSLDPSTSDVAPRVRITRSLSQFKETPQNFHSTDNVALYIRKNMTISLPGSGGKYYPLPESKADSESIGENGDTEQSIKITYRDVDIGGTTYSSIAVEINFVLKGSYYYSPSASVQVQQLSTKSPDKKDLNRMSYSNDGIAVGKSFACNAVIGYKEGVSLNTTDVTQLRLNGIQAQAFMGDSSSFGPSWDCVGFFSIGVWAGLIVTLIAIIILTMGLYMLSDIKTMDRFDDPKGKTIMVPQTAD